MKGLKGSIVSNKFQRFDSFYFKKMSAIQTNNLFNLFETIEPLEQHSLFNLLNILNLLNSIASPPTRQHVRHMHRF
jgi:hypothetical protein